MLFFAQFRLNKSVIELTVLVVRSGGGGDSLGISAIEERRLRAPQDPPL